MSGQFTGIAALIMALFLSGSVNLAPARADWELPQDLERSGKSSSPEPSTGTGSTPSALPESSQKSLEFKSKVAPNKFGASNSPELIDADLEEDRFLSAKEITDRQNQRRALFENTDVALLVDASMSMMEPDCPGMKTRWAVCKEAALTLAQEAHRYADGSLTLVLFGSDYEIHKNVTVEQIKSLFASDRLWLGTDIALALSCQLDPFFSTRPAKRRLVIAVLTDGEPPSAEDKERTEQLVRSKIVAATHRIDDGNSLRIAFFRIGQNASGIDFFRYLPSRLRADGAVYDIVRCDSLGYDAGRGLMKGLLESVAAKAR